MDRRKPELLSPAGDMEKLRMAVAYGADAVYLAGTSFGMRSFTGNFTPDELPKAVQLAHAAGVKVHCTVNIMPRNDEAAALPAYLEQLDAAGQGRAAVVSGSVCQFVAIVPVSDAERRLPGTFGQFLVGAQIPFGKLVPRIASRLERHHDAGAVDPFPEPDRKRGFGVADKRLGAPRQFLRRETDKTAVGGDRRKRPPETEAVRQEDVRAFDPEFAAVEVLSVQDIAREGLRGRDIRVGGVPRAARDMPAPLADVTLDQFVLVRVVLLHPLVLDAALEVEHVIGVGAKEKQVLIQRLRDVLPDRTLHVPVPLGIKMRVRD